MLTLHDYKDKQRYTIKYQTSILYQIIHITIIHISSKTSVPTIVHPLSHLIHLKHTVNKIVTSSFIEALKG